MAAGAAREIPTSAGMLAGSTVGFRTAVPIANAIPPAGLPGLVAKGAVLIGGGIVGAIAGAFAGKELGEAVGGEDYPVVPSLEPYRRAGGNHGFWRKRYCCTLYSSRTCWPRA
jgi:hypothetical protein